MAKRHESMLEVLNAVREEANSYTDTEVPTPGEDEERATARRNIDADLWEAVEILEGTFLRQCWLDGVDPANVPGYEPSETDGG